MNLWPWFTIHNFCDIEQVLEIDLMRLIGTLVMFACWDDTKQKMMLRSFGEK